MTYHHNSTTRHSGGNTPDIIFHSGELASWHEDTEQRHCNPYAVIREKMLAYRKQCSDWHVSAREIEIQPAPGPDGDRVFLVRNGCENQRICFNEHSLRQFCDFLGLPITMVRKLQADKNSTLLAELMKHYLHGKDGEYLLRLSAMLGENVAPATHELRAFLPANYNRLDNIYLLSGIEKACSKYDLYWKDVYCDRDIFMCRLIRRGNENKRMLLQKEGDTFVCGVSIENSEIGGLDSSRDPFKARIYFERLICTNGMTAPDSRKLRVRNKPNIGTHYFDELPDYPTKPPALQDEIDDFLVTKVIGRFQPHIDEQALRLQQQVEIMAGQEIVLQSEAHTRAIIREAIKSAGMIFSGGIRVSDIYDVLEEELGKLEYDVPLCFPITISAWTIYNAVTRYASSLIRADRRHIHRNYRLGSLLTGNTHRLSSSSLDWQMVRQRAEERIAKESDADTIEAPTV